MEEQIEGQGRFPLTLGEIKDEVAAVKHKVKSGPLNLKSGALGLMQRGDEIILTVIMRVDEVHLLNDRESDDGSSAPATAVCIHKIVEARLAGK